MNPYPCRNARQISVSWMLFVLLDACSASAPKPATRTQAPIGDNAAGSVATPSEGVPLAGVPMCASDNPFCTPGLITGMTGSAGTPASPDAMSCGSLPLDLTPAGVNIMIAVDASASMSNHWTDIATTIKSLRENNPTAEFGMHVFWADPVDVTVDPTANMSSTNNGCLTVHNSLLELGARTSDELIQFLGSGPMGGTIEGPIGGSYQIAPVLDALNHYLKEPTSLADPTRTNYLVLITSGNDNCFGSLVLPPYEQLVVYEKLGIELGKRNIRVIPVGVGAPAAPGANDPLGVGVPNLTGMILPDMDITTNYTVLERLLEYGGSGLAAVPRIDTPEALAELVSRVGQTINNCRFEIPATLDTTASVNPFELTFSINGKTVERDRQKKSGWDFLNGSTTTVEFYGQGCEALQAGEALVANKACNQDVCGTAAVKVGTKPRMMLLLLDSSASRTECVNGSVECLTLPGTEGRVSSYWEVVGHSVIEAMMAPVNDDVMFGMQFFPFKSAESLSCEVASGPEIEPAPGTQIAVMKGMMEKLPFGLSPVVGVMESVAAAPGKLADPGVLGTVVLLSDGGDNCSGEPQEGIVSRLGAAAKALLDAGVKTYAIRYGSVAGETPEAAEQLTAISTHGGTALAGSVAYLDAKSEDELAQALAGISDRLATCSFELNGVNDNVDKNRTSLFVNGEQIGFDAMNMQQDGWNWTDADRIGIQLFGPACTSFKTNRETDVVVEFGCEPVVVQAPD